MTQFKHAKNITVRKYQQLGIPSADVGFLPGLFTISVRNNVTTQGQSIQVVPTRRSQLHYEGNAPILVFKQVPRKLNGSDTHATVHQLT